MSYFDWNATTPMLPVAKAAWLAATDRHWANPSASYRLGAKAKLLLEESRESMANNLGVAPERLLFTSGATEASNAMIREAARRAQPGSVIWISSIEHPAVREAAVHEWGRERVVQMPVRPDGVVDLDWICEQFKSSRPAMVCLMAANNETGVIQPVADVLERCRVNGVGFFCDAVQWIGKHPSGEIPLSGMAGASLSAHKFGGPKGIGCLLVGSEWSGMRLQSGGGQEFGSRAGTENVAAIAAMAAALDERCANIPETASATARNQFETGFMEAFPGGVIHGQSAPRVWNTCCISMPQFPSPRWIARLDKRNFQVSTGAACSAGKTGPSQVMRAMGVADDTARRTIRISCGWDTRLEDWSGLLTAMKEVYLELQQEQPPEGPGRVIEV